MTISDSNIVIIQIRMPLYRQYGDGLERNIFTQLIDLQ